MARLTFTETPQVGSRGYKIENLDKQWLGMIVEKRVGRFMHWTFQPSPIMFTGDMWFTNGCLKEITTFISKLYLEDIEKRGKNDNTNTNT